MESEAQRRRRYGAVKPQLKQKVSRSEVKLDEVDDDLTSNERV